MSALLSRQLVFTPMAQADLDTVAALEQTLYEFPWSYNNFCDSLAAGYSAWICRLGDVLVGYAVMMLVLDEAHLLNLSVHAEWQRRGYGRVLLEYLQGVARRAGVTTMFLEVRPSNAAALGLYDRHGFRRIGRRRGYYPAPAGREDALVLQKDL